MYAPRGFVDFDVDVAALRGLPAVFDRLGDDARAGLSYLDTNTALEYGPGLINKIIGRHERVVSDIRGFVEDIAKYTAAQSGSALRQALDYYERTDEAEQMLESLRVRQPGMLRHPPQFLLAHLGQHRPHDQPERHLRLRTSEQPAQPPGQRRQIRIPDIDVPNRDRIRHAGSNERS
jgi:hypothetical protein